METSLNPGKLEVMKFIGGKIDDLIDKYLINIETNWQPSDYLPDSSAENFADEVKLLQESCRELPYDYMVVLVGDMLTEEALPTYESWLFDVEGVDKLDPQGWAKWVRFWTAEENRHGDLLNKYLYLSGRLDMRKMETTLQYLLADGVDVQTARDPYMNFVYTSFQETATNISHRRTATMAKQYGNTQLSKICGMIAADEARHARAYKSFVSRIFEVDPNGMMLAFEDMMRKKIVMPAHFIRQTGQSIGESFVHFSDAAQRIGVYTAQDYTDILQDLLKDWKIADFPSLNDKAEKAREYLMKLPERLRRVSERMVISDAHYEFNWIK